MSERLDIALFQRGMAPSRQKAREMIEGGAVFVDGSPAKKVSQEVNDLTPIEIRGEILPYVSRGGLKLKKAMELWQLDLRGKVCMDVGASTGGFTDCMLQNGAAKVYAVDVGTGQLHESLRGDPRVIDLEQTNVRDLSPEDLDGPMDFVSVDVSFISLSLVLPAVMLMMAEGGECIALIKPQFEAGKANVGKKGVVKDGKVHLSVLKNTVELCQNLELTVLGLSFSPVRGPEGNIEYLIRLKKGGGDQSRIPDLKALVEESHRTL